MYKKTRKEIKEIGISKDLISWSDFTSLAAEAIYRYNNESHSGLPRRYNKVVGRREYLTPQMMWDEQVTLMAEVGHSLVTVTATERDDLYRPYVKRKCLRCEINIFGNRYFSRELEQYHGEIVLVGYDIHDGGRIWVRDSRHRLIAIAEFEGNKKGYFEQNALDYTREKRAIGQVKRAELRVDAARENLVPQRVLKNVHYQGMPTKDIENAHKLLSKRLAMDHVSDGLYAEKSMKNVQSEHDVRFSRWLNLEAQVKAGNALDDSDQDFYELYPESKIFKMKMREYTEQ